MDLKDIRLKGKRAHLRRLKSNQCHPCAILKGEHKMENTSMVAKSNAWDSGQQRGRVRIARDSLRTLC